MVLLKDLLGKYGEYYVNEEDLVNILISKDREEPKVGSKLWEILEGYACVRCDTDFEAFQFVDWAYSNGYRWCKSSQSETHYSCSDRNTYFVTKDGLIKHTVYVGCEIGGTKYNIYSLKEFMEDVENNRNSKKGVLKSCVI